MLHITNGDTVVETFQEMQLEGEYLAWRDVLHEGPVPHTQSLDQLSDLRARFIAQCGWETLESARAVFTERDNKLKTAAAAHDEVVLWFEHDLYDQLQLLQVMAWLHANPPLPKRLSLLHPEGYLGAMPAEMLSQVFPFRQTVHPTQLELASRGWAAFTAADPREVQAIAELDENQPLPYLPGNFRRLLEEYPSARNGLTRAQQEVLDAVAQGASTREDVFTAVSAMEDPIFMGDWTVYRRLDELTPLAITESCQLTDLGRRLLAGEADWVEASGGIDVWLGGVHLTGTRPAWRWDADARTLRGA